MITDVQFDVLKHIGMIPTLGIKFERIPDDASITATEVADLLNIESRTVRRWCQKGDLPSYSFGGKYLIEGVDLKQFLRRSKCSSRNQRMVMKNHA